MKDRSSKLKKNKTREVKMFRKSLLVVMSTLLVMSFALPALAQETLVNLDYVETDVRAVAQEISFDTGIQIIVDQNVEGYVTVGPMENVPFEKALDLICASGGFAYVKVQDYYVILVPDPDNPVFQANSVKDWVKLDYINAKDVPNLLKSYSLYLQAGGATNRVTITALPGKMMEEIKQAVKALDVAGKQVEIQILASEVSEKSFREFGLGSLDVTWGDGLEKLGEIFSVSIGPFTFGATSQNDLRSALTLRVLSERGEAKITASPKIRVLEGHKGFIRLGEVRHIVPVIKKGGGTGYYTTYVEKEEVMAETGLTVNVSRVTNDNKIIFDLETNLEEILESVQQTVSGEIFRVNKRSAGTTLILQNYETIQIGSMIVEREKHLRRFPPYASGEKELIRLDLFMTANVIGTTPPPEYEGIKKFVEGLSWNVEPVERKKGFIARHPFLTLAILYGIYEAVSE